MPDDHRKFVRRDLHVEFHGRESEGAGELLFEGKDLSPGGTFLKSDLLLEEGDRLSLEFRVPGVPRVLMAQARVAWVRRFPTAPEPSGMGVEFLGMSEEDRGVLTHYLSQISGD